MISIMKTGSLAKVVRTACFLTLCIVCSSTDLLSHDIRLNVARTRSEATFSWPLSTNNFVLESAGSLDAADWELSWVLGNGPNVGFKFVH